MLQFAREVYRGSYRVRVKVLFILLFFREEKNSSETDILSPDPSTCLSSQYIRDCTESSNRRDNTPDDEDDSDSESKSVLKKKCDVVSERRVLQRTQVSRDSQGKRDTGCQTHCESVSLTTILHLILMWFCCPIKK